MIWGAIKAIGLFKGLAILAALVAIWGFWFKFVGWEDTANEWRAAAKEERKARTAWQSAFTTQKQSYRAAQETAKRIALEEKQRDIQNYRTIAERADNADQELNRYRALAERYARANRVRNQAGTARRDAGPANPAGAGDPAAGDNRAGQDAVVVERSDFDTLVDHSIRLNAIHKWGNELLAQGLAVKAEDVQ